MTSSIHSCVKCAEFNHESWLLPLKRERWIENSDLSPERLPSKSGFVAFRDYFGRFSSSNFGDNIRKLIWPPKFESKIGSKEPENRQKLISTTVSYENNDPPSYNCNLKAAYRECGSKPHEFILCLEYKGPKDAKITFSPVKTCVFISVLKETQDDDNSDNLVKATFDLSDPKYAPFLERFSTPAFKIRFIDSNLHFQDLIVEKPEQIRMDNHPS